MKIAITGGSGRIGRGVTALALAQGHEVVSIDRVLPEEGSPGVQFVQASITNYAELEDAVRGCDALVHMAALLDPNTPDYQMHNVNVTGSFNALSAAARLGITRVCQASSINAIGGVNSRWPRYDYFPLDERHPTYAEDAYSLSKWICEQQGDMFARRYEHITIASMRFHWVVPDWETTQREHGEAHIKHLWAYTLLEAAARACLLSLTADFRGHEAFYIVAPRTTESVPSLELAQRHFPNVPIRGDLAGNAGFFDCSKAERILGWKHS
ncbi:MAG: NAD(P)-dependent oxidoreductase [Chloroflexaceae bacterium]|jgi:UDP-glucose 4-epimerase|nr:NAD(P)-dependent oxidoreductase [Chloroflexaceae bacterium]